MLPNARRRTPATPFSLCSGPVHFQLSFTATSSGLITIVTVYKSYIPHRRRVGSERIHEKIALRRRHLDAVAHRRALIPSLPHIPFTHHESPTGRTVCPWLFLTTPRSQVFTVWFRHGWPEASFNRFWPLHLYILILYHYISIILFFWVGVLTHFGSTLKHYNSPVVWNIPQPNSQCH